jgi:predicted transcriptional regulator
MLSLRRGKDTAGLEKGISLKHLKSVVKFSQESSSWNFDWKDISSNLTCIKARAGTLKIYNPILPIHDSIKLREIVTHLICDGSALNEKHRTSKYASTSLRTVNELKEKLSIFGYIPKLKIRKESYQNHYLDCYILHIPKAITKLLSHKFKINFRSVEARLPKEFLNGERKFLIAVVRTFIIDEGCIKDRNISCCSGSRYLLSDLLKVCNKLEYKCQKLRKSNNTFYLNISPDSFEKVYNDLIDIGPLPIKEKQELLDLGMEIIKNKPNFKKLNEQIIEKLKHKSSTKLDLAKKLFINTKTIGERLLKLEKGGIVKKLNRTNGKGGPQLWDINS